MKKHFGLVCIGVWGCIASCSSESGIAELGDPERQLHVSALWPVASHDLAGTGWNRDERILNRLTVDRLAVDWVFDTEWAGETVAPMHAAPVVDGASTIYIGDLAGTFRAIDANGQLRWSFHSDPPTPELAAITPVELGVPQATAFVGAAALASDRPYVVVADANGRVYARSRTTGEELWTRRDLEPNPLGGVAGNALSIVGDKVLLGLSSLENYAFVLQSAGLPVQCCTHRGGVVALDLDTGELLWRYDVVPQARELPPELMPFTFGPAGGGVWSQPTYDAALETVYVGTGQNLSPDALGQSTNTSDSIIALSIHDGTPRWIHQVTHGDIWALGVPNPNPETGQLLDMDVGDAPKIYALSDGRKVVGAGQKDGRYHVLDAATGELVRSTQHLAPRNDLGGFQTGGAVADGVVFQHGLDATDGFTTCAEGTCPYEGFDGVVVALTPDGASKQWEIRVAGSPLVTGLAVAGRVLYFQSPVEEEVPLQDSPRWGLYAVDARSGTILKRLVFDGRALSTPVVARGRVYVTAGNAALGALGIDPGGALLSLGLR